MTIGESINVAAAELRSVGFDQPLYEARQLVEALLGLSSADLILRESKKLTPAQIRKFRSWLRKRKQGMPLAYLSGQKGFFKHVFRVKPGVLVPRPETELVVEVAIRRAAHAGLHVRHIADLGCGSGCIGLSLAFEWPNSRLIAIDKSKTACALTRVNARQLGISSRTKVVNASVERYEPKVKFDLIVANPPYIAKGDPRVERAVKKYEPRAALFAGQDGLEAIRRWIPKAFSWLETGGLMVMEIGAGQSGKVTAIMSEAGFTRVESHQDLSGIVRVISGFKER